MLRLLPMLAVLLTWPHVLGHERRRDPRHPFADPVFAAALKVGDAVRERFRLAAEVARCGASGNSYGYELLLSRFSSEQQLPIRLAAREGTAEGAALVARRLALPSAQPGSGVVNCASSLKRLGEADDRLVVLAERTDVAAP